MKECCLCRKFIERGRYCKDCEIKVFKHRLELQIKEKEPTIWISYLEAKESAEAIISAFNEGLNKITIKAKGKHISKAIDVLEIIKRSIKCRHSTNTTTEELQSNDGRKVNVSVISISICRYIPKEVSKK